VEENLASIDLQKLPQSVADQVREHVSRLSSLISERRGSVGADQFRYEVAVNDAGRTPRTFTVVDEGNPNDPAVRAIQAILALSGTVSR